jgi:hypothetical protein
MATSSVLNIITFILTTAFYYLLLKPTLTYDIMNNTEEYNYYTKKYYQSLGTYLALVLIVQFIMNTTIVTAKCGGGSVKTNILAAAAYTFFPWTLIFGVMMVVLVMYPGFKSAFSDVIGYFYVASSANHVLTELLIDKNIQQEMDESGATLKEKEDLQNAADAIIKICGNTSILINQIVPANFVNYWSLLNPLMKQRFQIDTPETTSKRNQLFDLVVMRDTIGEMMWYLYTGILLTSIVQMKISTTPCYLSPKQMEQNYQEFLKKEDEAQAKTNASQSTVYTITG